jgi:hypothetical protein
MKHLFFTGCTLIILLFSSCKKELLEKDLSVCPNCKLTDSPTALSLETFYINDSSWER